MISIATISLRSTHPQVVARFWRDLLGYSVAPNHSSSVLLVGDGPALLIQPADTAPPPGAIHLDLRPTDHDGEVARALRLGAQRADIGQRGDEGWTVMEDPAGNLFCILESEHRHQARLERDPGTATALD